MNLADVASYLVVLFIEVNYFLFLSGPQACGKTLCSIDFFYLTRTQSGYERVDLINIFEIKQHFNGDVSVTIGNLPVLRAQNMVQLVDGGDSINILNHSVQCR